MVIENFDVRVPSEQKKKNKESEWIIHVYFCKYNVISRDGYIICWMSEKWKLGDSCSKAGK